MSTISCWMSQEISYLSNTDFRCLATIGNDYSFVPLCQPPFISKLLAEDDCHLNGYRNGPFQTAPAPALTMLGSPGLCDWLR
ncbi:DUF4915 domain-containing protein [Nostoc sp. UIC 10630]|uniref:DUF4915 domain-containing protein n=1 Tax=Nostoc sp. UIC 10630 TaxID=2100146 RepID=UPI0013D7C262|nr:DUF4915 domain-containing protein [Nostoc sp. UIC 10630]NEU82037.1 DUF4915 domain-containing protein [Nostoc sp. UIC 10630]